MQAAADKCLDPESLAKALEGLQGWTARPAGDGIVRNFRFRNFAQAFAFMTEVAMQAEKADHHPDWSNVYNRVDVVLTTHSAGGVTVLDIELAGVMDTIARRFG